MTLTKSISPQTEAKLMAQAAQAGIDLATFAARTLEKAASRATLEEILAPLRAEFELSGMTETELTDLLETAKHEARAERRARKAS